MRTKLILTLNALWAVLVALNESGILDLVDSVWAKAITAFALALLNIFLVDPKEALRTVNPTPKPPKPPNK